MRPPWRKGRACLVHRPHREVKQSIELIALLLNLLAQLDDLSEHLHIEVLALGLVQFLDLILKPVMAFLL
jgi:hypothetical protein